MAQNVDILGRRREGNLLTFVFSFCAGVLTPPSPPPSEMNEMLFHESDVVLFAKWSRFLEVSLRPPSPSYLPPPFLLHQIERLVSLKFLSRGSILYFHRIKYCHGRMKSSPDAPAAFFVGLYSLIYIRRTANVVVLSF